MNPFPATFEFSLLRELPQNNTKRLFYPSTNLEGGRDGLNIHITPYVGDAWIGTFAAGSFFSKAISIVSTTPNPNKLCVVAEGEGYIVDTLNPECFETVPIFPILAVRFAIKHQLLIFANHTELLALGTKGEVWRSARLAWDSMKLTSMSEDELCGVFWDIRTDSEQTFKVDLTNGTHTGGALL